MLRYQMAVVTSDNNLKRAVKRLATSTGAAADFVTEVAKVKTEPPPDVIVFDAREKEPPKSYIAKLPPNVRVILIVEGDRMIEKVKLIEDPHVTSLFCHDERFDEEEFIATATKALRGEVFGLQKYFPWGVVTYSILIKNYEQKGRAIDVLLEYATLAGCRGAVRERIQLVCDELMMNALYHAPTDKDGKELYATKSLKELTQLEEVSSIRVMYGHSGRYFGVSVRDSGGSLGREKLLDYLKRAQAGTKIEDKLGGAGLGLVSVLRSASKIIFNLEPGSTTEVIALFDMELFAHGKIGARSLHVFTAAEHEDRAEDLGKGARSGTPFASTGLWAVVVLLVGLLAAAGTMAVMKMRGQSLLAATTTGTAPVAADRTLIIDPGDSGMVVKMGGEIIPARQPVALPPTGSDPIKLTVESPLAR